MSIYDKSSLVLIPSGTKAGKVYSQKPVSGDGDFTFTRSSAATRVNASGNIEKETSNLLLQSNTFDTTWTLSSSISVSGGQAGYDGSNDAWLLERSDASARYVRQNVSSSGVNTFSVYAKPDSVDWMYMYVSDGVTNYNAYFDLSSGALGSTSGVIDSTIESAGNGFYRCSISVNASIAAVRLYPAVANGSITGGVSPAGIYIQDAQLEQGLVARDYIETTTAAVYGAITDNVPRLDYTDSSCPALLLEPQRTNLTPQSEYFDDGYTFSNVTTTANAAISPEGVSNAYEMVDDATNSTHRFIRAIFGCTIGQEYTYSIFLKKGTISTAYLNLFSGGTIANASVDFDAGTITSAGQGVTHPIKALDNGWYHCSITGTASATSVYIYAYMKQVSAYVGTGDTMYIYGAQLEAGSYATSYIPTYGSSVTRVQATCLTASPSTSHFGQTEGTIYTEIKINAITSGSYSRVFNLKNSAGSNQIYFQQNDSRINGVVFNGSNQFTQSTSSGFLSVGSTYKMAMAYKNGDYALYVNGTQIGTSTATGLGTLAVDRVDLTTLVGNIPLGNEVKKSLVFKTRLSNEELAALTTI